MNLVETYVYNIQSVREETTPDVTGQSSLTYYVLVCDTNCHGRRAKGVEIILSPYDYESVCEKGYYLT